MSAEEKTVLKILIMGEGEVGKSSLLSQYVKKKFSSDYHVTMGADFEKKEIVIDDRPVTLQIWDLAGKDRYRSIISSYYQGSHGCILVYDVNNAETFDKLGGLRDDFLASIYVDDPNAFPCVVVGNKVDMGSRAVSTESAQEWCKSKGDIPFFETSALDGTNVEEVFMTIARNALAHKENVKPIPYDSLPDSLIPLKKK